MSGRRALGARVTRQVSSASVRMHRSDVCPEPMPGVRLVAGSRGALERRLADEVRAKRERDLLAPLPIVVGGTLMRPYLRRRLALLSGGHLNVRLMTVG